MTPNPGNPFGFSIPGMPGSGTAGSANPVLQSLEMMQQAWGNLGALSKAVPSAPPLEVDELDRRITDLRAIENWLNLNLTMLRASIQGLEVQRATISTLRSFAQSMGSAYAAPHDKHSGETPPSPLEVVLGLRPAPAEAGKPPPPADEANPAATSPEPPRASAEAAPNAPIEGIPGAQAWWNLLQEQFNRIASASAASMPQASPPARNETPAAAPRPRKTAAKKRATPTKTARKTKGSS